MAVLNLKKKNCFSFIVLSLVLYTDIAEVLGIAMDRPYGIDIKLKGHSTR